MHDIRAVLFDAGNTLVFVDPARFLAVLHGLGVEDADETRFREAERLARLRLVESMTEGASGSEGRVWREYFMSLFRRIGLPPHLEDEAQRQLRASHEASHLWSWIAEDTPRALGELREQGYRLAVVSNADGRVEALLESRGLAAHFEFVIDSHIFGVEKPDPRIFWAAVERLGLPSTACVYVGDLYPVDVLGARAAGLHALLVDPWDMFEGDTDRIRSVGQLPDCLERVRAN